MGGCVSSLEEEIMATTQQAPSPSNNNNQQHSTAINAAISKLQELGINFLALDFDQTILDVHTRGRWNGTLEELLPHVRPVFAQLIQAALANNIHVAIVTFTTQIKFVRGVLESITPHAEKIPIRGSDRSWSYNGEGSQEGKQPYMASAVEELEHKSSDIRISKQTTLLIDDDARNIRYALADGTRAVWFNPDKPHLLLQDLIKLV
jgi:hypothetical protein